MKPKWFALSLIALSGNVLAHKLDDDSGVSGQLRLGYIKVEENEANSTSNTFAVGGKLSYQTRPVHGLSAGASIYSTNPLAGVDEAGLFLDSGNDGYSILGEAYIKADMAKTTIKAGRQELDTPFADTDDIGMVPNTFEGILIYNQNLANVKLFAAHLHRWAGVDAPTPEKFTRLNGDDGVNVIAALYKPSDKWSLQGWRYEARNNTNISYLEADLHLRDNMALGLQYAKQNSKHNGNQNDADFNGRVWGVSTDVTLGDLTLSAAHNQVTHGQVSNGFGGGPFFTSAEDHTIAEVKNQQATAFRLEYTGFKKLKLSASHVDFKKGENELDLSIQYAFSKKLSADLIYSDMYGDGSMTRAFVEFTF